MNQEFAFISRHTPTAEQHSLANEQGVSLIHIGDADAFTVSPEWVLQQGAFGGVVVVHPAAAMRLGGEFLVGVFNNVNRAEVGEKPDFHTTEFHVFDLMY